MLLDLYRKCTLAGALTFLSVTVPYSSLFGKSYVGIFGGGGDADDTRVSQRGYAYKKPDVTKALSVHAKGKSGDFGSAMAGAHFGYDFETGICLRPALEFEGFYLRSCGGEETSFLFNQTVAEHAFVDTLPLRTVVFFGDVLLAVQLPFAKWLEPYVGGGIGGAVMWISGARSEQDSPPEPGLNHFNSKPTASDSAFAAQFKTGLRFNVHRHWRLFVEYRYLYLASTTYTFGFTQYPSLGHVPTGNWILHLGKLDYNLGTVGVEYKF